MKASSVSDIHDYLRQHATRDIRAVYRRSKAARGPYRPDEPTLVQVFALPGPEHEKKSNRKDRAQMRQALGFECDTIADGPTPMIFFTTKREAQYFVKNLDTIRRELAR
jgi:hypothetical protein